MRAPQLVSDFFEWRWAPCVGLTAGSLAFVALALLFIPTHVGGEPRVISTLSSFENARPQRAIFGSALTRGVTEPEARHPDETRVARSVPPASPPSNEMSAPPQRGFSPILERPPPVAAAPVPAPAEPPAAAPVGAVAITQTQPVPGVESREGVTP